MDALIELQNVPIGGLCNTFELQYAAICLHISITCIHPYKRPVFSGFTVTIEKLPIHQIRVGQCFHVVLLYRD